MNVGDRVVFINDDFTWCGEQFTVTGMDGYCIRVLSDTGTQHYFSKPNLKLLTEDPTNKQASTSPILDIIKTFTMNHKNLEISFEDGKIIMRDFTPSFEPEEYRCDTIEQLEELLGAWEKLCKFKVENSYAHER